MVTIYLSRLPRTDAPYFFNHMLWNDRIEKMIREFWHGYWIMHSILNWLDCPVFVQHIAAIGSNNLPIMFAEHLAECRAHASKIPKFDRKKKIGWIQTNWNPKARGLKKTNHAVYPEVAILIRKQENNDPSLWVHISRLKLKIMENCCSCHLSQALAGQASEELQRLQTVAEMRIRRRWTVWERISEISGTNSSYDFIRFGVGIVYSYGKKPLSAGWCFEILPFLMKSWLTTSENITKTKLRPFHTCLYGKVRTGTMIQLCQGAGGRKAWLGCCCIQPVEAGRTQC